MKLYWGDLHNHCGISYGFGSLENALAAAKSHLDFCAITGHAMWPDMYARNPETAFVVDFHQEGFAKLKANWEHVRATINQWNRDGLTTFQSYEMHSSRYGDYHVLSPDDGLPLIYRESPGQLVRDCGSRAVAVPHHIGYTPGYRGIDWDAFDESISPVVEVLSKHGCAMREDGPFPYFHDMGPLDPRNTVAEGLRRGHCFSFVGSTDHHAGFPGSYGDGLAAIWAESNSREALWEALRKGHTYAVTGDRIACHFTLNDAMMGESLAANKRTLLLDAEGDAPLESLVIRKNGRIVKSLMQDMDPRANAQGIYKLRLELGWGHSPDKYHWQGTLKAQGGSILRVQPYYRGLNALSPSDSEANSADETNSLNNGWLLAGESEAAFWCDTVCNKSTLHPQTTSFVFEVQGGLKSLISLEVNGQKHTVSLADLLDRGFAAQMKPWHSHAYKMHTAYGVELCKGQLQLEDCREQEVDVYQAEVTQINGHRAFLSPIFVS